MSDLNKLSIHEALKGLKNKDFTSVELTEDCIKSIESQKKLNAFITETFDIAREHAILSDEKILGNNGGRLEGIPLAIKDIYCTKDVRTTAASKMLENYIPPYESTVTQKLIDAGYVMLGKTNMDEFANGSTTTTGYFGHVINCYKNKNHDRDLSAGGSSGGSAVSVAGNMCLGSLGSDTGGSVRQPAALTNIVGIRLSYGRCSRYGVIAFASSFDQAGVFTKNVRDAAILSEVIAGYDHKDSTLFKIQVPNFEANLNSDIRGKTVGLIEEYENLEEVNPEIYKGYYKTIEILKARGAKIKKISMPNLKHAALLYTILAYGEVASNLSRYDGVKYGYRTSEKINSLDELYSKTRGEGFGKNLQQRILIGWNMLMEENYKKYYLQGQKVRRIIFEDFQSAFKEIDVFLTPITSSDAFEINMTEEEQKIRNKRSYFDDLFTIPVNLAGLPAISIPSGFTSNELPTGVQIIGNRFDEQSILNFGLAAEEGLAK
jgi:aspartyl-tRNA(Asn)/glutamyl-tRNA(Gln) amidotransferase subunit A